MGKIGGILFDSGGTLVRPVAGEWWPRPRFRELLERHGVKGASWEQLESAILAGQRYLDANHDLQTEEEELAQFERYYEIKLASLGVERPAPELVLALAQSAVTELEFEMYEDTARVIEELQGSGIPLGLISNAWPSLDRKYRVLGIRDAFDPFVISAQVGCCKPEERIYRAALEALDIPPENLLFVDDWEENVRAAIALGLRGVVMARKPGPRASEVECVTNLEELLELL